MISEAANCREYESNGLACGPSKNASEFTIPFPQSPRDRAAGSTPETIVRLFSSRDQPEKRPCTGQNQEGLACEHRRHRFGPGMLSDRSRTIFFDPQECDRANARGAAVFLQQPARNRSRRNGISWILLSLSRHANGPACMEMRTLHH